MAPENRAMEAMRARGNKRSKRKGSLNVQAQMVAEEIPTQDKMLEIVLEKMNDATGLWQGRDVTVTSEKIFFSKKGSKMAIASINLWEISKLAWLGTQERMGTKQALSRIDSIKGAKTGSGESQDVCAFEIRTLVDGPSLGMRFKFKTSSEEKCKELIEQLETMVEEAKIVYERRTKYQQSKKAVAKVFQSMPFQIGVAILIAANFLFNVIENQMLPEDGTAERKLFDDIDLAFTVIFTIELAINLYGNWARPFFTNGWSLFDLLVVSVSLLALFLSSLPGFSILRLLRVFRVMRLFGRIKSLKKIITAIGASIIPVLNSFVILFLIACIYALIGIQFFSEQAPHLFGTFSQAIIVMFQLTAGNSWIDDLPAYDENGVMDGPVVAFLVSYIVIVNWTLLQVSVAVLLDNFVAATAQSEAEAEALDRLENPIRITAHALDSLLALLSDNFDNHEDLVVRIDALFDMMDVDNAGKLSFEDLLIGLRHLPVQPQLYILSDDLDQILESAGIEDAEATGVTRADFRTVMTQQVLEYVQRRATDVILNEAGNSQLAAQMGTNKLTLSLLRQSENKQHKLEKEISGMKALLFDISARLGGPSAPSDDQAPGAAAGCMRDVMLDIKSPKKKGSLLEESKTPKKEGNGGIFGGNENGGIFAGLDRHLSLPISDGHQSVSEPLQFLHGYLGFLNPQDSAPPTVSGTPSNSSGAPALGFLMHN